MFKKVCLLVLTVFTICAVCGCAKKKISSDESEQSAQEKSYRLNQKAMQGAEEKSAAQFRAERQKLAERELEQQQEDERLQARAELEKEKAVQTITEENIYFAFDSFKLSPESRKILQDKAETLKKYSELSIVIEGYCDERGTEEYNLALGERRARAAYEFLILLGVDTERMQIVSYGEEYPVDPGHNEAAWAKNRRDEFRLVK